MQKSPEKPSRCPFCNSSHVGIVGGNDVLGAIMGGVTCWSVICGNCSAKGPVKTREDWAVEAWNMRARR